MTAMLAPLRKAFLVVNPRIPAPLIRAGGGPLLTTPVAGSILLLRTTGKKSGLRRTQRRRDLRSRDNVLGLPPRLDLPD